MTPVRRAWALSLVWIAVIALESFGGSAEHTGNLLYPVLKFFFPHMKFLRMFQIHFLLRKAGHFFGYSVLSLTLYRSWWTTLMEPVTPQHLSWRDMLRNWDWRAVLLALVGTLALASLDEFHQSFVPGRTPALADVGLDELGGILAQCVMVTVSSAPVVKRVRRAKAGTSPLTSA